MNKTPSPLGYLITYLESTDEKDWCMYTTIGIGHDNEKCLINHMIESNAIKVKGKKGIEFFEKKTGLCRRFLFEINDKYHPEYQQETPKERCIQFFKDLKDNQEETLEKAYAYIDKKVEEQV